MNTLAVGQLVEVGKVNQIDPYSRHFKDFHPKGIKGEQFTLTWNAFILENDVACNGFIFVRFGYLQIVRFVQIVNFKSSG